jgi:hypothetical protein
MVRLDEIAQGIVSVLAATREPEPLRIDLWNETAPAATVFVRAMIEGCLRNAVPISMVEIGPEIGSDLTKQLGGDGAAYEGVSVRASHALGEQVNFYRFEKPEECT